MTDPQFQQLSDGSLVMYGWTHVGGDVTNTRFRNGDAIPARMIVARHVHIDGTVGDRIGVLLADYEVAVITVHAGGWGIAVLPLSPSDDIVFYPSDRGTPRSLRPIPTDNLPACGYAQPPDWTLLWENGGDNLRNAAHRGDEEPGPPPHFLQGARLGIELSQPGVCLRWIEAPRTFDQQSETGWGALRLDARPGNILMGTVDDGARVRSVRCSAAPAVPRVPAARAH